MDIIGPVVPMAFLSLQYMSTENDNRDFCFSVAFLAEGVILGEFVSG